MLTEKQWLFLNRYAAGHGTTLLDLANFVVGQHAPAPAAAPRVSRPASKGADRKYLADRARCADAAGILERFLDADAHTVCAHDADHAGQCREANHAELRRLQRAADDPALLWSIYRRADKSGLGHYATAPAAATKRRKAA